MGEAAEALRNAAKQLEAVSDTARLEAELLLAFVLGIKREKLLLDLPGLAVPSGYAGLIKRRLTAEPIAHIVGVREFWGLDFRVSSDALIPRPDSELLIEESLRIFTGYPPARILDLGTGSGALLLSALSEFDGANGLGMDASSRALEVAHNNADRLKLSNRAKFALLDWTMDDWTQSLETPFDLILCNPPYVSSSAQLSDEVSNFEPHEALFAGELGLDDYRLIIPALSRLLTPGGTALLEIGFDQAETVTKIARENGYHIDYKKDLGGNDRMLILRT